MSLFSDSAWNFGHTIDANNQVIEFNEGSGTLTAFIDIGAYTLAEFANAVASAMNGVGNLTYEVSVNRGDDTLTIESDSNFSLLVDSISSPATSAFALMGFTGADRTGASTYTGNERSGSQYIPQFKLQNFVDFQDNQSTNQATVNTSASGNQIEVVSFGDQQRMQCNITLATDIVPQGVIREDANGVLKLRAFLNYARTKAPLEFLPDVNSPSDIIDCILDRTPESSDGTAFRLRELYARGLTGYFETGNLTFLRINF